MSPFRPLPSLMSRWSGPGGYKAVLQMALPLVMSTGSWTVQHFVDRMFLCWYSPDAMAASLPAGLLSFTFISFFIGTASYVSTFVAQYVGAKREERVGASFWQGVWFALGAALFLPLMGWLAGPLIDWGGHAEPVRTMEHSYFRILMIAGGFHVLAAATSSLYTGLGRTWPVMWVHIIAMLVNLVVDYALIFGNWGFPEWGIAGAAWATNIAHTLAALIFVALIFLGPFRKRFNLLGAFRPDKELFRRLMRYGLPSGFQFMLDMVNFTIFVFLIGRIGPTALAATNLAFQVNLLAFMPMIGFGIATTTLVGQALGADNPALARRSTWSTLHLTLAYMGPIAVLYVATPDIFILPFAANSDPAIFPELREMAKNILIFVAIYCVFDTLIIVFSSAIKGAGDTRFVMIVMTVAAFFLMVLPTWVACIVMGRDIYTAWFFLTGFIITVGTIFLLRFLQGKWEKMRVIESVPPSLPPSAPDLPVEVDI